MWSFSPNSRDKEIIRKMSERSEQYIINDNGTVSVDTSNPEVVKKIHDKFKKFENFDVSNKATG